MLQIRQSSFFPLKCNDQNDVDDHKKKKKIFSPLTFFSLPDEQRVSIYMIILFYKIGKNQNKKSCFKKLLIKMSISYSGFNKNHFIIILLFLSRNSKKKRILRREPDFVETGCCILKWIFLIIFINYFLLNHFVEFITNKFY